MNQNPCNDLLLQNHDKGR